MAIDFSEIHQTRIAHVNYHGTVHGRTLSELGINAVKACDTFFGDQPYTIEGLDVDEVTNVAGAILTYQARFTARAR